MASVTAAPGASPARKGLAARFAGIVTSPRETFQFVVAQPRWFGMLALTTVFGLAIGLAVLYRRRTQPIASTLLAVYALVAVGIALVSGRFG